MKKYLLVLATLVAALFVGTSSATAGPQCRYTVFSSDGLTIIGTEPNLKLAEKLSAQYPGSYVDTYCPRIA